MLGLLGRLAIFSSISIFEFCLRLAAVVKTLLTVSRGESCASVASSSTSSVFLLPTQRQLKNSNDCLK